MAAAARPRVRVRRIGDQLDGAKQMWSASRPRPTVADVLGTCIIAGPPPRRSRSRPAATSTLASDGSSRFVGVDGEIEREELLGSAADGVHVQRRFHPTPTTGAAATTCAPPAAGKREAAAKKQRLCVALLGNDTNRRGRFIKTAVRRGKYAPTTSWNRFPPFS